MAIHIPLSPMANQIAQVVQAVIPQIRPKLMAAALSGDHGESANIRHADNFLSIHDIWMHERYRDLISDVLPSFVYASEEADPQIIGDDSDPDLCVLVDPLDTSELAVRALNGYTHVMVYSRQLQKPVASVVGDIFHHVQLYVAGQDDDGTDRAFALTADSVLYPLRTRQAVVPSEALVTNYSMRPAERFIPLAAETGLLELLSQSSAGGASKGRIGVDFGSVGLCHVAAGFTDAMIEFAKGFAIWDLAPGHHILQAAGGSVVDLEGAPLSLDYGLNSINEITAAMNGRRKFVAAANSQLAQALAATLLQNPRP